ncbi:MAG: hypothetical protein WAM60_06830 [Candidatus Promineifilaceae bacterium]
MQVVVQIVTGIVGLGFVGIVFYAALYISDELERTSIWPLARTIKAIIGGVLWGVAGILTAAGLFAIAVVLRAIFFRPLFSIYLLQFWGIRLGLVLIAFYLLWGVYHGARNRLRLSYSFRR